MHSERRWDLGSKRRIRQLKLRGNWPALVPLFLTVAGIVVLWILYALHGVWVH